MSVCQMFSCHYSSHNSRFLQFILSPFSSSIKENPKQTENAAVSGQILTHSSRGDTVTVVNYIFTLQSKYCHCNIRISGEKCHIDSSCLRCLSKKYLNLHKALFKGCIIISVSIQIHTVGTHLMCV